MKKKLLTILVLSAITSTVFAASSGLGSLVKSLNALDNTKAEPGVVELKENRDLFPVLLELTKKDLPITDDKTVSYKLSFESFNFISNSYIMKTKEIYKFGIGLQCKDVKYSITCNNNSIIVDVLDSCSYSVNRLGEQSTEKISDSMKVKNQYGKLFSELLKVCINKIGEEEYKSLEKKAYSDLQLQIIAGKQAPNKLKAKKWYENHPIEGEEVDVVFNFYSLAESDNSEYAYVLSGLKDLTVITVYSNNDNYIDYVEGSKVTTKGVVNKVRYSENYDEIKTIEIVEK